MNAQEAKDFLRNNLEVAPDECFWDLGEHYQEEALNLVLRRANGSAALSRKVPYSDGLSQETLNIVVLSSKELVEEFLTNKEAEFSVEDIQGIYSSEWSKKYTDPETPETEAELPWWKRAINWLWYA